MYCTLTERFSSFITFLKAIDNFQYQAVVINPEQLVKPDGGFERLSKNPAFTSQIISTIFDEAHCISAWGAFRPEYSQVGRIRIMLPKSIPIMITSATLPPLVLQDVLQILGLKPQNIEHFRCSCDRPNIHLIVRPIRHSLSSFADLTFLLRNWKPGDPPPPKFLVFFDNINDAVKACLSLMSLLPIEFRDKLKWFNSDMSKSFKENEPELLISGDTWGFFTTDSFGMVRLSFNLN
jgi:hypothetical protein